MLDSRYYYFSIPTSPLAEWFRVPLPYLPTIPLGMDLSIPPTPLPATLPRRAARWSPAIFRPNCLPKPLRYLVLSYDATFQAFQATSWPIFVICRPFPAT